MLIVVFIQMFNYSQAIYATTSFKQPFPSKSQSNPSLTKGYSRKSVTGGGGGEQLRAIPGKSVAGGWKKFKLIERYHQKRDKKTH